MAVDGQGVEKTTATAQQKKNPLRDKTVWRYLFFFGAYYALMWPLYLVLVSLIDFFHLQLGHHLGTMEAWIFAWAWPLVLGAKFLSLIVWWKIIGINEDRQVSWKKLFKGNAWPSAEIWTVLGAVWFLWAILCRPQWVGTPWYIFGEEFVALAAYYLLDAIYLKKIGWYLEGQNQGLSAGGGRVAVVIWLLGLEAYAFFALAFPFAEGHRFYVWINTALVAYLALWRQGRWADLMAVALGLFACGGCGFGQDPVWGTTAQVFRLGRALTWPEYFILAVIILGYWWRRQERRQHGRRENLL